MSDLDNRYAHQHGDVANRQSGAERRPPRLLVKTLVVTFTVVAALLVDVFVVVSLSVRTQVRDAVSANLASSQRVFATLETRRQGALVAQAAAVADSPTLKAALDTYQQ